jgi:hypothetical protein
MPLVVALHAPYTAALHRVGDHHLRRPDARRVERVEDIEDRIEVMPIDLVDLPAEALESCRKRLDAHDALGVAVDREVVPIDDSDE